MALRNHALDDRITEAAAAEFLENGFKNASLRKIAAQAGVTIGAIHTRYQTKDALFCALVQPLIERIGGAFAAIRGSYYGDAPVLTPEHMAASMQMESEAILHLLFDDYDRAVLLLCRSAGSSLESFVDSLVEQKIRETLTFFGSCGTAHPDARVLRLMVSGQFHMYFQIIRDGYDLAAAKELMQAAMVYHTGGWLALLQKQAENQREDHHEI